MAESETRHAASDRELRSPTAPVGVEPDCDSRASMPYRWADPRVTGLVAGGGSFPLGDVENDSVKTGFRGEAGSLFVSLQCLIAPSCGHQAMPTGRHKHGALLGGGHTLDESVVLLLLRGHRIRPFSIVGIIVSVHPNGGSFNIEVRLLILPTHKQVVLRADQREWILQSATNGDVKRRQRGAAS